MGCTGAHSFACGERETCARRSRVRLHVRTVSNSERHGRAVPPGPLPRPNANAILRRTVTHHQPAGSFHIVSTVCCRKRRIRRSTPRGRAYCHAKGASLRVRNDFGIELHGSARNQRDRIADPSVRYNGFSVPLVIAMVLVAAVLKGNRRHQASDESAICGLKAEDLRTTTHRAIP